MLRGVTDRDRAHAYPRWPRDPGQSISKRHEESAVFQDSDKHGANSITNSNLQTKRDGCGDKPVRPPERTLDGK